MKKRGIRIVAITQDFGDDNVGMMMRHMVALFDEHSSRENAKHALRAMIENARRGFANGRPPFGYRLEGTDVLGARGKTRKKYSIDEEEATVVRDVFRWSVLGDGVERLGLKKIASKLNHEGRLMRGRRWTTQQVFCIVSNEAYVGRMHFNKRCTRDGKAKPREQWILVDVPPIVDEATFEQARDARADFALSRKNRFPANSVTLLGGLLCCAECGSTMTTATGKSGKYRYYKCSSKLKSSTSLCSARPLPMTTVDQLVVRELIDNVLTPDRLTTMVRSFQRYLRSHLSSDEAEIKKDEGRLRSCEEGIGRLLKSIEEGISVDDAMRSRISRLQQDRRTIISELAELKRRATMPFGSISEKDIVAFGQAVSAQLLGNDKRKARAFLRLFVNKIEVRPKSLAVRGPRMGLLEGVARANDLEHHMRSLKQHRTYLPAKPDADGHLVPMSMRLWRPEDESNVRPAP